MLRFKFYRSTNFKQMDTFTTNQSFSENMHIPQRDIDTAEAAKPALSSLHKVLSDTTSPKKLIRNALIPVFWHLVGRPSPPPGRQGQALSRPMIPSQLKDLLGYVSEDFTALAHIQRNGNRSPQAWTEWRASMGRFNLDDEFKLSEWIEVIDAFTKLGWNSPTKLALVSPTQLRTAFECHSKGTAAIQLWTAATLLFADLSSASFLVPKGASENAEKFLRRLKSAQLCPNSACSNIKTALNKSKIRKLPINFDQLGPAAKLKMLQRSNLPLYKANRFFRTASQSVALTGIHRCFESFASGIRRYYSFCELKGTPLPSAGTGERRAERDLQTRPMLFQLRGDT